jgi:uncharacterized membrane protein HdeD (DUF308 family)
LKGFKPFIATRKNVKERQERLQALAAEARDRVSGKLGDLWWAFMARGIFAGALGLIVLIWPTASLTLLIRLVGIYILGEGVVSLLGAWRASEKGLGLWRALASVVIGLVFLIWPQSGLVTIAWVIALAALLVAGLFIFLALRLKNLKARVGGMGAAR